MNKKYVIVLVLYTTHITKWSENVEGTLGDKRTILNPKLKSIRPITAIELYCN